MISDVVLHYFASSNIPVEYSFPDVTKDSTHYIYEEVKDLMASFEVNEVKEHLSGSLSFLALGGRFKDLESKAREMLAVSAIDKLISRRRLMAILPPALGERPLPYGHQQIVDVPVDKNWLINISDFKGFNCDFSRGDTVFHILPSLPQLNSMYWASGYLSKLKRTSDVKIRLDPFMVCQASGYSSMAYKMLVYGIPLDWNDIGSLKEDRHMRWMPDNPERSDVAFTDAVWSLREDGVHFACEEVPKISCCCERGSRYFHSIYSPSSSCFLHADGAIRIYSHEELTQREKKHVRNSGKSGVRVKVFQVDGEINRDDWCSLVAAFFVWNSDVQKYFDPSYPF